MSSVGDTPEKAQSLGYIDIAVNPLGIVVEPEAHMVADKRADISVLMTVHSIGRLSHGRHFTDGV
jgi:hypothetical protein